jgi:hypothetical protein
MELGDVENCLRGLKGVSDVAVIAKKSSTSTRLIGYITLSNPNIKTDLLKDELRKYLPEYMIPWKLIAISALPRNVNGKLDRKALESKRIRTVESQTTSSLVHDSQDLSSIISTYSEVLGVDITGHSNYFECGGDSLSSMRIVSQLNTIGIPVGIRDILLYQTPLELHAYLMRGKTRTGTHSPLQGRNPMQSHYCSNLMQSEIANSEIQAASFQLPATAKVTTSDVTKALITIMRAHTEFECGYPHPSPLVYNLSANASAEDYYKIVEDGRQLITLQHPLIAYLSGSNTIVLIASHLVTDYYSWDTIRTELVGLLERSIRQIPTDSSLALWWGNKLKELKEDPTLLEEAASYWTEPVTPIKKRRQAPTYNSTLQSSFTIEIAPSLLADMQSKSISTESLGIYLLVYSQLSANSEDAFSCMIESSLRSIDDKGTLQNGVGWMTYLFPKEYTSTSLQHSTLLNFHNNLAYALKHGYQYGLLRYNLQPRANARSNILWTINYLGETTQANSELSIIRTLPLRKKPFIEVEIHYHAGTLIYDFMYNHLLSAEFLAFSKTLMEERIRALDLSIGTKSLAAPLDSKRRKSILERLRDASQH